MATWVKKSQLFFQTLRTRLHIDRKQYETLCQQAEKAVKEKNKNEIGDNLLIKGKSLSERYENCLFSAEIYSDVVKELKLPKELQPELYIKSFKKKILQKLKDNIAV